MHKNEKIYRLIFWSGYLMVIIAAFVPIKKDLHTITFDVISCKAHMDQILHSLIYFLICLYFIIGQISDMKLFKVNTLTKFILVTMILATISEAVQLFIPTRVFNFFDWIANIIGIIIGIELMQLLRIRIKLNRE